MRRGTIRGTSIALAAAMWLVGAGAAAESAKAEAKKHFEAGNALVDNEDYKAATAEFELSVRIFPTKMGLFNLANCYKALNRYGDALEALARLEREFAGKLGGLASEVSVLKNTIEGMVGRLAVKVDRDGAALRVDGTDVGVSPLGEPLILAPGDHVVEARLSGYVDASQTARIAARETLEVAFVLEVVPELPPAVAPLPPEPPAAAAAGPAPPGVEKPETAVAEPTPVVPAETPPPAAPAGSGKKRGLRAGAWASFIVGVTAGLVSGALYGLAITKAEEFADAKRDYAALAEALESDGPSAKIAAGASREWNEMEDAGKAATRFQKAGLGFGIGAGVLVAASAALFMADHYGSEGSEESVTVAAAPGGLAVEF